MHFPPLNWLIRRFFQAPGGSFSEMQEKKSKDSKKVEKSALNHLGVVNHPKKTGFGV